MSKEIKTLRECEAWIDRSRKLMDAQAEIINRQAQGHAAYDIEVTKQKLRIQKLERRCELLLWVVGVLALCLLFRV